MKITLTGLAGPRTGQGVAFEEHDTFIVGRKKDAKFQIKDKFFSRYHFIVEVNPPLCRLTDMGSTNGTKVNGRKVPTADLQDGDLIAAGESVLRVSVAGSDAHPDPAPEIIPPPKASADNGADPV